MKGWRTVAFNVATGVIALSAWPALTAMLDPQVVVAGVAVANLVLRLVTTTPVGEG